MYALWVRAPTTPRKWIKFSAPAERSVLVDRLIRYRTIFEWVILRAGVHPDPGSLKEK